MKVCIYGHSFPPIMGGAQTYQYNLARGLADLGHDVLVLTGAVPPVLSDQQERYEKGDFRVIRLEGASEFSKMQANSADFLKRSYDVLRDFDPDVIYSNGYAFGLAVSLIRTALRGVHVFSYHSTPELDVDKVPGIWKGERDLELAFSRFVLRQGSFDAYIACSKYYLEFAKEYLSSEIKNAHQVYYGVDMDRFSPDQCDVRDQLGLRPGDFVMLCPVRLLERKGIFDMLDATKMLVDANTPRTIRLVIPTSKLAGNALAMREVIEYIRKLGIEKHVILEVDSFLIDDMPSLYASADVMVLPSYAEGLGIVSLEAMAMRVPVIATDIPGVREVVRNEQTGLTVPVREPAQLASAIVRLRDDIALKNHLIEAGHRQIERDFNHLKQVKKVAKIFADTIKEAS